MTEETLQNELEYLKRENKELRQENQLLHENLKSERNFFMEYIHYHEIEEYRITVAANREHQKELQELLDNQPVCSKVTQNNIETDSETIQSRLSSLQRFGL